MTTAALGPSPVDVSAAWAIGTPRLTAGLDRYERLDWATHQSVHGPIARLSRERLETLAADMGLLGRGGAAFPVARKLRSLPRSGAHAVVVNASESEPPSGKDRLLAVRSPHLVLDGLILVADAVGARKLVVAVHDRSAAGSFRQAVAERRLPRRRVRVELTPDRFVSGEARAVINGLDGRAALPPGRRVIPTQHGVRGRPTFLSNAETFAQLAVLARLGRRFADAGVCDEPGTTLLTVGGAVARPAVVEIPNGMPLGFLLQAVGSAPPAAVVLGGYHGSLIRDPAGVLLSRPALASAGLTLGAGVVVSLSHDTCLLSEVAAVTDYLAAESAGQCGPCVFGLPALAHDVRRAVAGDARGIRDAGRHLAVVSGRGACAHPDGVSRFVTSCLRELPHEIRAHVDGPGCGRRYLAELPLPGWSRR